MWTQGLNPEQAKAVGHNHGPLLILAGAGSGKTTVLVARTGRLIADRVARPEEICVLTFTNKAARELKHRVANKLGSGATGNGRGIWAGTFHSFGLQILRQNHKEAGLPAYFGILDQTDSAAILKELLKDITIAGKDKFDIEKILEIVNHLRVRRSQGRKEKLQAFDEYHEVAEVLLPKYMKKLDLLGAVDFEGLLLKPLELFKSHPEVLEKIQNRFSQMMVDEFQDTNETQMKLIGEIVKKHRNITVVGDDDQSIYGWRGAQVANILDFPKIYAPCEVIKLERNYRSTPAILGLANELISKNRHRHGKILKAEGSKGAGEIPEVFVIDNDDEEAEFAAREIQNFQKLGYGLKDIAILYRSNSQGGMIESVLRKNRVPYTVSGGTGFFDRKEVKDILAYLRFSINANDVGLRRIINTPPRGVGDTTIERINEHAVKNKMSFVKAAYDWRSAGAPEKSGESISQLFAFLKALPAKLMTGEGTPGARLMELFREIGYRDYLYTTTKEPHVAEKKWLFIEIFSRVLDSFVAKGGASEKTLREFVDAMELRDDGSDDSEEDRNKVSLMTLHACKGLEFPCVLIVGVEEDLIPHKTLGTDVDEERRLFYVGLTRAKERLVLSRCKLRKRHGQLRPVTPSRFLLELPAAGIKAHATEFRPVTAVQRENLLTDFLSNLDKKIGPAQKKPSRNS